MERTSTVLVPTNCKPKLYETPQVSCKELLSYKIHDIDKSTMFKRATSKPDILELILNGFALSLFLKIPETELTSGTLEMSKSLFQ